MYKEIFLEKYHMLFKTKFDEFKRRYIIQNNLNCCTNDVICQIISNYMKVDISLVSRQLPPKPGNKRARNILFTEEQIKKLYDFESFKLSLAEYKNLKLYSSAVKSPESICETIYRLEQKIVSLEAVEIQCSTFIGKVPVALLEKLALLFTLEYRKEDLDSTITAIDTTIHNAKYIGKKEGEIND